MNILVITDNELKQELWSNQLDDNIHIQWTDDIKTTGSSGFDVCIDLLFENDRDRIQLLKKLEAPLVIVNSVIASLGEIKEDFVRINGWRTFLHRPILEASCSNDLLKSKTQDVLAYFGKKIEWVPDIPGFITPRIIASIINEAYFAVEEKISSKEEIDTAMKLGTNYPYGPFEWSEKAGLKNIHVLLSCLALEEGRYQPAPLLVKEALA